MARFLLAFFLVVSAIFQPTWGIVLNTPRKLASSVAYNFPIRIEVAPYMAALFLEGELWCGATVIDELFVLTAASCLSGPVINGTSDYKVLVGSDQLNTDGIFIDIESIHCHYDFDGYTTENDICLLKLKETVPFGCIWTVEKINLPDNDDRDIVAHTMASAFGWSSIGQNGEGVSNELQQAFVPVVENGCCRRVHPYVTNNMICAGTKHSNFCAGVSGGPLVSDNVVIGVATHGGHDCISYPSVYTRVASYLTWIEFTMYLNR